MRELEPPFDIEYLGAKISVAEHEVKGKRVFYLVFAEGTKPLTITVGERPNGDKFWTSIPQGRQAEAEQFGKLIANFIRSKRKA